MKTCSKCGEVRPLDDFSWKVKTKGYRQSKCKACVKDDAPARRKSNAKWRAENPEAARERRIKYYRRVMADPARRARERETYRRNYKKSGYGQIAAKRRAAKLERTPSWANDQLIAAYYKEAKRLEELTGIQFHVDHIIPLQGELVSGLHVETNLQLLPAHENLGKSNSFDPMTFVA